jgi:hypothetical protein
MANLFKNKTGFSYSSVSFRADSYRLTFSHSGDGLPLAPCCRCSGKARPSSESSLIGVPEVKLLLLFSLLAVDLVPVGYSLLFAVGALAAA